MKAITVRRQRWRPAIRPLRNGQGVAAIGDVHGQDDLYGALSEALLEDLADAEERWLIQLGDLVDRGPSSLGALRRAKAGLPGVRSIALKGNHEDTLIGVLDSDDAALFAHWMQFGGADLAAEAGVDVAAPDWRARFRAAVGEDLVTWLEALPTSARVGDLVFAHAGVDPVLPLAEQSDRTLMWTRKGWIDSEGPYAENVAVIHGHTPQAKVDLGHPHRINLDTGAFRTGLLSALVVVGDRMRVVQAAR